jgi:hypothetical protein
MTTTIVIGYHEGLGASALFGRAAVADDCGRPATSGFLRTLDFGTVDSCATHRRLGSKD